MPARKPITFETVRSICLALPDVTDATAYGSPAFKVKGKMFACIPTNKAAEPNSLMVRVSFAQRDEMIAAEPGIYYVKEHYEPYTAMLVRLSRIHHDALKDLLHLSARFVSATKKKP